MTRPQLAAKRQAQAKRTPIDYTNLKKIVYACLIVIMILLALGIVGHYDEQSARMGASVAQ